MRDIAAVLPVVLSADLSSSGWNGAISTYPDITPKQFAMQALYKSILKKYEAQSVQSDSKALDLFLKINTSCQEYCFDTSTLPTLEFQAINFAKDQLRLCSEMYDPKFDIPIPTLGLHEITDRFGLGNGANIGCKTTDFLSKIGTSSMAATSQELCDYFTQAVSKERTWSDVESIRSRYRPFEIVEGSRLSFVPKTAEISRTICTEPLLNMLFQKGIARRLEDRLAQAYSIRLAVQPERNRELARLGSLHGRFGTIDLSSASDSISLTLVRALFPPEMSIWFERTRSKFTILPDGRKIELHMVSSMGNAFTFPLQTMLFASLVYGAYRALGIPFQRPGKHSLGNFAVFGDDIIVDSRAYDLTCRLLVFCGFSVNVDKSFNEGSFRESCGHDYFDGYNVRGVYIKHLHDMNDRYSAINRLHIWSAQHGIPLCRTIQLLLMGTRVLLVPFDEEDRSGIKAPSRIVRRKRFNRYTGGLYYRCYVDRTPSIEVNDDVELSSRLVGWFSNPPAILHAALAGTLRSAKVVPRSNDRRSMRLVTKHSSRWDYVPFAHRYCDGFSERWKSFVEVNLSF